MSIVDVGELGRRVRSLRLERRMTLKQIEALSGLSATHLSEIERGRTSPTIGALTRIARALDRDASHFIEAIERDECSLHLREQGAPYDVAPGVTAERLTEGIPGGSLHAYRLHLTPGDRHALELRQQPMAGQTTWHVESGTVLARMGEAEMPLAEGDTLQASLELPQRLAASGGAASVLLICTRALEEVR